MRFLWLKPRKCRSVSAILYQYSWIMFSIHCIRNACPFTSHDISKINSSPCRWNQRLLPLHVTRSRGNSSNSGSELWNWNFHRTKRKNFAVSTAPLIGCKYWRTQTVFFFFMRMESKTVPKACSSIKSMEIVKFRVWSVETETFIKQRGSCKTSRFLPILWLAVNDDVRKPLTKNSTSSLFQSF